MKIKQTAVALVIALASFNIIAAPLVHADCGGVVTSIVNCEEICPDGSTAVAGKCPDGSKPNGIWGILILILNILTGGVGVAAIGGIVYGSILYTSSGGSMDQVKKAKEIIRNTIIGILAYALMFAFLNYLIPGGLFK